MRGGLHRSGSKESLISLLDRPSEAHLISRLRSLLSPEDLLPQVGPLRRSPSSLRLQLRLHEQFGTRVSHVCTS